MASIRPFIAASGNAAGTVRDAVRAAHGIVYGSLLSAAFRRELTTTHWRARNIPLAFVYIQLAAHFDLGRQARSKGIAHVAHPLDCSEAIVILNTPDMAQSQIGSWVEAKGRAVAASAA